MYCLTIGRDLRRLMRSILLVDDILILSMLSITGLNFLAKLLVRNFRISRINLNLRGTSLDSNNITLMGVEIRQPMAILIARY